MPTPTDKKKPTSRQHHAVESSYHAIDIDNDRDDHMHHGLNSSSTSKEIQAYIELVLKRK